MLLVQEYLKNNSLEKLTEEFAIRTILHPTEDLVILNYNQLESPKTHPIVRECRSLVLNSKSYVLVSKSMNRFFNWGEVIEEMNSFNFSNFVVNTKVDGSLINLFNYNGLWRITTKASFANGKVDNSDVTWEQLFCQALKINNLQDINLNKNFTYVCELVSPYNKIVRMYKEPQVFLLTMFENETELHWKEVDNFCCKYFTRPDYFHFKLIDEIIFYLSEVSKTDPTFEGVVICDNNFKRWKIKNPTYLSLHALRGESGNLFNPKYLISFVLNGDESEFLNYFPEAEDAFNKVKTLVNKNYDNLEDLYFKTQGVESQKEFALSIIGKTPFTGILFELRRKYGINYDLNKLKEYWEKSNEMIYKILYK